MNDLALTPDHEAVLRLLASDKNGIVPDRALKRLGRRIMRAAVDLNWHGLIRTEYTCRALEIVQHRLLPKGEAVFAARGGVAK